MANPVYVWQKLNGHSHLVWYCGNNRWSANGDEAKQFSQEEASMVLESIGEFTSMKGTSPYPPDQWPGFRYTLAAHPSDESQIFKEFKEKYFEPGLLRASLKPSVERLTQYQAETALKVIAKEGDPKKFEVLQSLLLERLGRNE